jgi:hypothetical protein
LVLLIFTILAQIMINFLWICKNGRHKFEPGKQKSCRTS